jgi:hypothetical protein
MVVDRDVGGNRCLLLGRGATVGDGRAPVAGAGDSTQSSSADRLRPRGHVRPPMKPALACYGELLQPRPSLLPGYLGTLYEHR